jgi:hypothetical protein
MLCQLIMNRKENDFIMPRLCSIKYFRQFTFKNGLKVFFVRFIILSIISILLIMISWYWRQKQGRVLRNSFKLR